MFAEKSPPTLSWTRTHNAAADDDDRVYGIAIDASGNLAVAGSETGSLANFEDWMVRKYDANGGVLWSDQYNSKADDTDLALAVAVDSSGNLVAGGYETRSDRGEDANALVRKYGPTGAILWGTSYNDSVDGFDSVRAVAVDAPGDYVFAGDSDVGALLMKYDSDGNRLWATVFHGAYGSGDSFNGVACDSSGNIIAVGYVDYGFLDSDWLVCKYDPSGALCWARTVPEGNNADDLAMSVAVDASGNAYVAGYTNRAMMTQGTDWAVRKYDASGNLLWQGFHDGPSHSTDIANAVSVDTDGGAVVAGDSEGILLLRKYTPGGGLAWSIEHANPYSDLDTPNAVSIRGHLMAVGGGELRTDLGEDFNWLVLKYGFFYDVVLSASTAHPGEGFTVVFTVTNIGDAVMKGTGAGIFIQSGAALAVPLSVSASPVDLMPGTSRSFTWNYLARAEGTVSFLASVSGTEAVTGATAYAESTAAITICRRPSVTLWLDGPGAALDRNVFLPALGEKVLIRINPSTTGPLKAGIFTASGRRVRTGLGPADSIGGGQFVIEWDGRNDEGRPVERGVYLVQVVGGGIKKVLKVVAR